MHTMLICYHNGAQLPQNDLIRTAFLLSLEHTVSAIELDEEGGGILGIAYIANPARDEDHGEVLEWFDDEIFDGGTIRIEGDSIQVIGGTRLVDGTLRLRITATGRDTVSILVFDPSGEDPDIIVEGGCGCTTRGAGGFGFLGLVLVAMWAGSAPRRRRCSAPGSRGRGSRPASWLAPPRWRAAGSSGPRTPRC